MSFKFRNNDLDSSKNGKSGVIVTNNAKLYRGEQVIVRSMTLNERAVWEKLWNDYLSFYETELSDEVKNVTWVRLHDPNEPMYLLAACLGGHVVGIVHYLFHRSCWTLGNYCYLQDLFVAPQARGLGVGHADQDCQISSTRRRCKSNLLAYEGRQPHGPCTL